MVEVIYCAPSPQFGESRTLSFLRNRLGDGHHVVLTNYYLPHGNTSLEIDLVVVNRFGVFLIEVKDWYGKIVADDIFWRQGKRGPVKSPITSIDYKAKVMHGFLSEQGMGRVSVTGLVVLARGTQMLEIGDPRRQRVFGLDDSLVGALTTDQHQAFRRPPLGRSDIDRIKDTVVRNHVKPSRSFIGQYQIVRELRREPGQVEFQAQHTELNRQARIKAFQVLEIVSQKQLAEQVRRFRRDIEALDAAGTHPNLVSAYEFFKDEHSDEFYYLILEWVAGETLADLLARHESVPLPDQLAWMQQLASALSHVHGKDIVHRNLTPENTFLAEDGTIKLGNFDFAKVPVLGQTISVTGIPLVQSRYAGPEMLTKPRQVDGRTDIYSLGAVWFDLLTAQTGDEPLDLDRLQSHSLPNEVLEVLARMVAPRRAERYQRAAALLEDLGILPAFVT
ncbi:MAG: protein kinase [Ardenticatenia bacterium]|nr:protein kinase [Ardenticatenia bacterium]